MRDEIHRAAYSHQLDVESGKRVVVGVNRYETDDAPEPPPGPDFRELESRQIASLGRLKGGRDSGAVGRHLGCVREVAGGDANLLPAMIDAVKAGVTLGEISDALRSVWGTYGTGA